MNAQEKWLQKNGKQCARFGARISRQACADYSMANPESCKGCAGLPVRGRKPKYSGCGIDGCAGEHYAKGLVPETLSEKLPDAAPGGTAKEFEANR